MKVKGIELFVISLQLFYISKITHFFKLGTLHDLLTSTLPSKMSLMSCNRKIQSYTALKLKCHLSRNLPWNMTSQSNTHSTLQTETPGFQRPFIHALGQKLLDEIKPKQQRLAHSILHVFVPLTKISKKEPQLTYDIHLINI